MDKSNIFVTSHPRIGPVLASEMSALGYKVEKIENMGVYATGSFTDAIRMNLYLRSANRVLFRLIQFNADNPEDLYKNSKNFEWENVLSPQGYFSVQSSVRNTTIKDNRFANLRLKDAIVDRMKEKTGARPNSGPLYDASVIFLYWHNDDVIIYYDTSGETISRRGYRKNPFKAPMNESLAAAILIRTGWDGTEPFVNPMCGSGTAAIEAAMISMNKPPGLQRENFSFMHHRQFNSRIYRMLRNQAIVNTYSKPKAKIIASDINPLAIKAAKENAKAAGVARHITFKVCDFSRTEIPGHKGVVFLNPEYGKRLGEEENLKIIYAAIGDFFKKSCSGYKGYVFSGNPDLAKSIGLKTSRRTEFYNGKIDCRLLEFDLYKGSLREV